MQKGTGFNCKQSRLYVYSLGLLSNKRIKRILFRHGWLVRIGFPKSHFGFVGIWGRQKTSKRGLWISAWRKAKTLTIEDGFLRSLKTGRQGDKTLSLVLDQTGIYFATDGQSDLENLIYSSEFCSKPELKTARDGIDILRAWHLTKYNAIDLSPPKLPNNYVLVIDQTYMDASVTFGGASFDSFDIMLKTAILEHPNTKIIIKTHPEKQARKRSGYFDKIQMSESVIIYDQACSPWHLFDGAKAVYCVTSQMGLEAIFSGHKPIVFGRPFYSGWGLTDDRNIEQKEKGVRSAEQLFWASYLKYTCWYDPYFDRASDFFNTARILVAQRRAWLENRTQIIALGMRLWKRGFLYKYLQSKNSVPIFVKTSSKALKIAKKRKGSIFIWAGLVTDDLIEKTTKSNTPLIRVEDGFIRSNGLGAELVRPVSLAFDDLGIYYDPSSESRLELLISDAPNLPQYEILRARKVKKSYVDLGLSKYNLEGDCLHITKADNQKIILIPGQVEDDASILKGTSQVKTNYELIKATRKIFPNEYLIYKPHPDVEAGLRCGVVPPNILNNLVDQVADKTSISDLLKQVDHVCTMTSLAGFEALIYGKKVTCFGAPFYAGWGLTDDQGDIPKRRIAKPNIDQLLHASLIEYPRYWDPVTGEACPIETLLERYENREFGKKTGVAIKILAKLQGALASYTYFWR